MRQESVHAAAWFRPWCVDNCVASTDHGAPGRGPQQQTNCAPRMPFPPSNIYCMVKGIESRPSRPEGPRFEAVLTKLSCCRGAAWSRVRAQRQRRSSSDTNVFMVRVPAGHIDLACLSPCAHICIHNLTTQNARAHRRARWSPGVCTASSGPSAGRSTDARRIL